MAISFEQMFEYLKMILNFIIKLFGGEVEEGETTVPGEDETV